jgi:hypothetical protein
MRRLPDGVCSAAAVAGHCLLGLARIATGDRIEMERSAQIQNLWPSQVMRAGRSGPADALLTPTIPQAMRPGTARDRGRRASGACAGACGRGRR